MKWCPVLSEEHGRIRHAAKRGELVPIGEALADLGGPVKAIREATPQARHSFTVADQVSQLVSASEADAAASEHRILKYDGRTLAIRHTKRG